MDDNVLSNEEMNAISEASNAKDNDLIKVLNSGKQNDVNVAINNEALHDIVELTWDECEKIFSSFFRKKVTVKVKGSQFTQLGECLKGKEEKHVFSVFSIKSHNSFSLVVFDMPFLHQAINVLFGGQPNNKDKVVESAGNVGLIVAEKIARLTLDAFAISCKEYGDVEFAPLKSVVVPNLISKLSMDDQIYALELTIFFGDIETSLLVITLESFLQKLIPIDLTALQAQLKLDASLLSTIEKQVVDSYVTLTVSLDPIVIRAKELLSLKEGDLIPIEDPTIVKICMNDMEIYHGHAGQANAKRVVKILDRV